MKKTFLAVAIPTILFATPASAVEIFQSDEGFANFYGQLRTEVKKLGDKDVTLNAGSSRAGVQAQYKVTDTVDVFGKVEFGLNFDTASKDYTMKNRLHYFGIDTHFGKVSFGRQWTVSERVSGTDYSYFFGGSALRHSTLSGSRHDSLIQYYYGGETFWITGNYGLSEDNTNQELAELYAGTSLGSFNFHLGAGQNRNNTDNEARDLENTYFEGTIEYTVGAALIGFTYYNAELQDKDSDQKIKENAYSLAGTYSWANNATAYMGYEFTDQDASKSSIKDGDSKVFYIGSDYNLNKWSRIYVEYAYVDGRTLGYINKGTGAAIKPTVVDDDSLFAVGARIYW